MCQKKTSHPRGFYGLFGFVIFMVFFSPFSGLISNALCTATDDGEEITYRVTGNVYYGDKNRFKTPCVLEREDVFAVIPEYKAIKREGLDKNSARYYLLLEKANQTFRNMVKEVAKELGYDLVVEDGGIKASKKVRIPDITKDVIKAIEG